MHKKYKLFTGIIECVGKVNHIVHELGNIHFEIESNISAECKIDQSIAHNGVCLTVIDVKDNVHIVTAIQQTLDVTNLGKLVIGSSVNLERCLAANARFDGHIVQGHVDTTAICVSKVEENGSWRFGFELLKKSDCVLVPKGSICINGVSLTIANCENTYFEVCIIPYTYSNTNFHSLLINDTINIEFDIIGKYVQAIMNNRK